MYMYVELCVFFKFTNVLLYTCVLSVSFLSVYVLYVLIYVFVCNVNNLQIFIMHLHVSSPY